MAISAGIRNLVLVCHGWADKSESVATNVHIGDRLFDPRHVTGDTLIACASNLVVRVFFNGAYVRPVRRSRTVAFEAHDVCRLDQQRVVIGAVDIVATGTFHAARVHHALNKIVSLHAVLMRRTVRKVRERRLA